MDSLLSRAVVRAGASFEVRLGRSLLRMGCAQLIREDEERQTIFPNGADENSGAVDRLGLGNVVEVAVGQPFEDDLLQLGIAADGDPV
jgi:hypothetical protein